MERQRLRDLEVERCSTPRSLVGKPPRDDRYGGERARFKPNPYKSSPTSRTSRTPPARVRHLARVPDLHYWATMSSHPAARTCARCSSDRLASVTTTSTSSSLPS